MDGRWSAQPLLRLFVYGTLKRGGRYHDRFCRGALEIEEATVWGRLYTLPAGYPALVVPEKSVLAEGTSEPLADAATQTRLEAAGRFGQSPLAPTGEGWQRIGGEILAFADPSQRLPRLDALEGFHPGARSLYRRALLAVQSERTRRSIPAWTYVAHTVVSEDPA